MRASADRRSPVPALVLLGALVLQVAWVLAVPPFRGIDEPDQAFRTAAVAHGEWRSTGSTPDGRGGLVTVPVDLVRAAHRQCSALRYNGPDNCVGRPTADPGLVRVGSGAARYNPVFYWLVGTPALPFHGVAALYVMRAAGALLCALGLAVAAWCLGRRRRSRGATVGLLVGASPVFVYATTMPAPNGVEMVAGVVLWSALLALDVRRRPGDGAVLLAAAVAGALLVTVRSLGPVLALLVLGCVLLARRGEVRAVVRSHARALWPAVAFVAVAGVGSVLWILVQAPLGTHDGDPSREPYSQLLGVPLTALLQSVAAAPLRDQPAPILVYPLYLGLVLTLLVLAVRQGSRVHRRAVLVGVVLAVVVPVLISAAGLREVGLVWQGRYLLPFVSGVAVLAGWSLDRARAGRLPVVARVVLAAAWVLAQVVACAAVNAAELDRPVSAGDPGWPALGTAWIVVLALAGAAVLVGAAFSARCDPARAAPADEPSSGPRAGSPAAG